MIRLFRVFIPTGVLALLLSEIVLVSGCYLLASYILLDFQLLSEFWIYIFYEAGLPRTSLVVLSVILGLYAIDLYSRIQVPSRIRLLQDLCQVIGIALLAQGLIAYSAPAARLGRGIMLVGSLFTLAVLFAWRLFYSAFVFRRMGGQRILFVGCNQVVEEMAAHILEHPQKGLSIAGYLVNELEVGTGLVGGPVLGRIGDLRQIVDQVKPDRIVIGLSERRQRMPMTDLLELRFAGYVIEEAGTTYETVCGRISTKELRPSQLIFTGELGPRPGSIFVQNIINYTVALVGAVVTLPLMILVALAVKLTSSGPILFRQTRVGKDSVRFVVYKFRSMRADAEAETGAVWAIKDDPRVTSIGRWLRMLRLDELQQIFNVLRGEMSLVGPRPERPEFVKTLSEQIPYYPQRLCVKPGITGWAQINHKYGDSLEDTIVKNLSPSLDAYILFHTLKTMIQSRGAQ